MTKKNKIYWYIIISVCILVIGILIWKFVKDLLLKKKQEVEEVEEVEEEEVEEEEVEEQPECYSVVLTILKGECNGPDKDLLNNLMKCRRDKNWYKYYDIKADNGKSLGDCPNFCPHQIWKYVKPKSSITESQRRIFNQYVKKSDKYKNPNKYIVWCNNWKYIKDFSEVDYEVPLSNIDQTQNCDTFTNNLNPNQWTYIKPKNGITEGQMKEAGAIKSLSYTDPQLYYIYCNNFDKVRYIATIEVKNVPNPISKDGNREVVYSPTCDNCNSEKEEPGITGVEDCSRVALEKGYSGFTIKDINNQCYLEQPCKTFPDLPLYGTFGYSNYKLKEDNTKCISNTRNGKGKNILFNEKLSKDVLSNCFDLDVNLLIKISTNSDHTQSYRFQTSVKKNNPLPVWSETFKILNLRQNDNIYLHLFENDRFVTTKKISFAEIKKSEKQTPTNDVIKVTSNCKDDIGCGQISFNYRSLQCTNPSKM